jgi:hypothetical protein
LYVDFVIDFVRRFCTSIFYVNSIFVSIFISVKVLSLLEGCLHLILSPSPSLKFKIKGGKIVQKSGVQIAALEDLSYFQLFKQVPDLHLTSQLPWCVERATERRTLAAQGGRRRQRYRGTAAAVARYSPL